MEHTFINVSPHRAKVRHQQTRRKTVVPKVKRERKPSAVLSPEGAEAYPTPYSLREDVGERSDVEEVPRSDSTPKSLNSDVVTRRALTSGRFKSMPLRLTRTDLKKEDIDDLFSDSGNLTVPYYVQTYGSRQTSVPHVLNYYLNVAGPTAMWRPVLIEGNPDSFRRSFFQLSMKEPIMFEAVIAISQAHLDLSQHPGTLPSTAVLQHRGKVLRMLQASLVSSPGNVADIALMAVFCMLVLDIMFADWTSVKANMQGFRHLASLRGGIDNLGWSGWFRVCFSWAELRWAGHIARANETKSITAPLEPPTYPTHPFNPATCLSISRLPQGLREAALQKQLSNEVISFLEQVQTWTLGPQTDCAEAWVRQPLASFMRDRNDYLKSLRISVIGADILGKYILKPTERLLCIGVIAYIISADGSADDGRQAKGLDDHLAGIQALCAEAGLCDYLLWAGLVLAASTDGIAPLSNKRVLLDRMLELDTRGDYGEWSGVKLMLRKYFWNPFIEAKWEVSWLAAVGRKAARKRGRG
jgi:hypothetical protein